MSDLNISLIMRFVDRATAPARKAMGAMDGLSGRVRAGTMAMSNEFSRWNRLLKGGSVLAGAYGLSMTAMAASFVRPAAQFERFEVQLTTLEGSAEGAKRAMAWIEDFATRTPISVEQTTAAYAKLKAFGIDPTNGSMQALVDTMAATGGGAEQLDGLVLALGQSWSKGKLQGEEALQMLERGVPVWDILAKKLGKTTGEVQEMASAGKLGRDAINLLVDGIGEANKGASENMARTWDGMISNLMDWWTKFQRMVMGSGVFTYLKSRLRTLLDTLEQMASDGRLQRWADQLGTSILNVLHGIGTIASGAVEVLKAVVPWIRSAADALGGWRNLIIVIAGLSFARTILTIASAAANLAPVAILVGRALVWMGSMAVRAGAMLLANPIFLAIAAIAGAAYVIYDNWSGIVAYFQEKIDAVRAAFDQGLLNGVLKLLSEFNPFRLILEGAVNFIEYLTGWDLSFVTDKIAAAFDLDLFAKGVAMIRSLWEGMKSIIGEMATWVSAKIDGMMPAWLRNPAASGGESAPMGDPMGTGFEAGRALGGPVRAGHVYRWMEEGQELFMPKTDGAVISTRELKALRGGGSSSRSIRIGDIIIHAVAGQSAEDLARAVRRELERLTRAAGSPLHDGGAYAD